MSSINPNNINGNYPVAGQDNNSQGFRDNFTNIKNNFTFAQSELADLQAKAILKSALTGGALNNDLQNAQLKSAQFINCTETINDYGNVGATPTVTYSSGHFQRIQLSAATTLTLTGWPSSGFYAKMRLRVEVPDTSYTLTLATTNGSGSIAFLNLSDIQGADGQTITFPATGIYLYEFSSYDGGATVTIVDLINNYQTLTGNINITGTLTTSGARVEAGYQYNNTATTSGTLTVSQNVNQVILDPSAGFTGYTITLPTGNVDAQTISISSTATIASLTVNGNAGTVTKPSASLTLTAGTAIKYFFHNSEKTWYKIG